jgi:hypothetical protein
MHEMEQRRVKNTIFILISHNLQIRHAPCLGTRKLTDVYSLSYLYATCETERLALNSNKTLCIFNHRSTAEIDPFSNTGLHKVSYVLSRPQYGHN